MVDLVPDENPLKPMLREVQVLMSYATTYRYSTFSGRIPDAPSERELDELIKKVDEVLTLAISRFGVDLAKKGAPAAKPGPIR
jgi:hypothetical protein